MATPQDVSSASKGESVDNHPSGTGPTPGQAVGNELNTATASYITGWRLHLTTIGYVNPTTDAVYSCFSDANENPRIALSLFLVNLEVTIVSTSLIAITNDLGGFNETSWIVSGYLITYTGMARVLETSKSVRLTLYQAFIILWAKISDILGRKSTLLTCLLIFLGLSAGCGASATLDQL